MTGICDKRQRDLIHSRQRERIITAMNILKKSITPLSLAMQNSVKYSHNPQAQVNQEYSYIMVQIFIYKCHLQKIYVVFMLNLFLLYNSLSKTYENIK